MAERTVTTTHSDLSGEPGAITVHFAFENAKWEIDLTRQEREELVRLIAPYTAVARRPRARRAEEARPRFA